MSSQQVDYLKDHVVEVTDVHKNTSQEIVEITVDKLMLVLHQHKQDVDRRNEWQTPLGLVIAILATFITAQFKAALGFSADTWAAVYVILLILSLSWLCRSLYRLWKSPKIEDIVQRIKRCG
jgi:hypothetical protein